MQRKWWTLVLISIATFMLLLDITVVNVALPDIQREPAAVVPPAARPRVVHAADVAFTSGFNEIILIAATVSFLAAALGYLLVRSRDFVQPTEGVAEPAAA